MDRIKVGILGCTGLVGQQFIQLLDGHPYFDIAALSSSDASAGNTYGETASWILSDRVPEAVRAITLTGASPGHFSRRGVNVIFSALPADKAAVIEKSFRNEGMCVFSNAAAHRMDPDVPIIIPEINHEHMAMSRGQAAGRGGFIVTNPNCTTTGLAFGLKPLLEFGLKSVTVTSFQALSGAGLRGIASMEILDNVIPHIKGEEEKIERETQKIFGKIKNGRLEGFRLDVLTSCCRVPTRNGHLESIMVETEEDPDIHTVKKVFAEFRGLPQILKLPSAPEIPIILRTEEDRPQPVLDRDAGEPARARGMAVTIGRIRKKKNRILFFLLVHNTIRGAAGTSILNAELAVEKRLVG